MADVESNIHVNIDTSDALASLKLLQRQISAFHTQMAKSGTAASAVAANQAQNLMNSINATGQFQASMRSVTSSTEQFTDSLERNKLTSREYFRYTGAATKTFGRLFRTEFDTINKVARERVKDIQTQYIKLGRGANGSLQAIAVRPLTLDMKNLGTQTAIAAQRQQLLNQLLKQGSTNLLNFGKNTQWAGRQLMVGFTVPLAMLGTTASKTFMKLEEQAIRFKRVYGELFTTQEETDAMVKQIQLLAKEYTKYGVAVEDTMKMAADAAAMGKMGADLTAQVAQATRLAVLGGVEQTQALETTISVTNAFGVATEDLAKKIDFLNAVENQTVVSIEDLTIAMPKAGPVVQQLGGQVEDLAFFLTAMKEGGINASEGANALKSGLASLINPSEKASKFLASLGVNIKGIVESNKGDVKSTVIDFANALDTLDPLNRARAIEQLFGKFQFSRLSTLFQNVIGEGTQAARVLKLTNATTEELAILSERELSKIQNTTTYKFKKSMEDLKVAIAPVGEQFLKALTPIVEFVGKILDKFNNLGDGSKKFLTIFTVAVAGVGPILLMTFGLIANAVANIIKLFAGMKSMYNKTGSASKVLGDQTNYLTKEQLEASAVAASLDQVHTKLKQTFTSEASAVNMLANAYRRAIAAQLGFTGVPAGKSMPKPKLKYSSGTTSVPGVGSGDTVHALLTPGEAVIPKEAAQDPANRPIIEAMVNQNPVEALAAAKIATEKTRSTRMDKPTQASHVGKGVERPIADILQSPNLTPLNRNKLLAYDSILKSLDLPRTTTTHHSLMYEFDKNYNRAMAGKGIPAADFLEEWKRLPDKFSASGISKFDAAKIDQLMYDIVKEEKLNLDADGNPRKGPDGKPIISLVNDDFVKEVFEKRIPEKYPEVAESRTYRKMDALYNNLEDFRLGKGLKKTVDETKAVLEIAKKSGAISDFSVIPTAKGDVDTKTGKLLTGSIVVVDNNGNSMAFGRGESGDRITTSKEFVNAQLAEIDNEKDENKKGSKSLADRENEMKKVAADVAKSPLKDMKPEEYSRQLEKTVGRSFTPAPGIGGIYERPDGSKVFVKPAMDYKSALAEYRATEIARRVHGLDTPEQTIKTMIDPTDPKSKRKIVVLESALDDKFDGRNMSNKFTPEEYIRQNVAAALRADKDLGRGNLGGNVLTDVGPAGVFATASGDRDFAQTFDKKTKTYIDNLPSMEQQARINLGIDEPLPGGGRKRFFAVQTKELVEKMTADEYQEKMKAEIQKSLDKIRPVIESFGITDPKEKAVYEAMEKRLEAGLKADWKSIHKLHSSVAIKPGELLQDDKTGDLTKPKTEPLPSNVKSSQGKKDTLITQVPAGKSVVQALPKKMGKVTIPGAANAPDARIDLTGQDMSMPGSVGRLSDPTDAVVAGAKSSIAEAKAVGANIGTNISQSAAAVSRTLLYGTGPVDAEAKSIRRRLEKEATPRFQREKKLKESQAKAAVSRTTLYGSGPIDADAKSLRRQMEKRSRLAERVAYEQRVISEKAAKAAQAQMPMLGPNRPTLYDKTVGTAAAKVRTSKVAENLRGFKGAESKTGYLRDKVAGRTPGAGMGGAMGVASGVAMIGSMAPGKVGEISQKIMMPLMGMAMIMPMLQNKFSALAVGVGLVVAAYAYQRMVFDKAQDAAMELTEAMGSGTKAIKSLSEFSTKVGAGEIMDRRRKEAFSPFQIKTGKTTFGESFMAGESGKAMAKNVTETIKTGGENGKAIAKDQVANQLMTAVASGALDPAQARSIAANLGEQLGDYSFGIEINSKLISMLGPNGENILKDGVDLEVNLLQDTRTKMNLASTAAQKAGGWTGKDVGKTTGYSIGGAAAGAGAGFVAAGIGAAGAAAAGAAVGSAVPVVGTIIGAALGAGVGYFLSKKDRNKRIGEASGASIAMQKIALQQQQELTDSVEMQYQKELEVAKAAGDTAEIKRLTTNFENDQIRLLGENAALVSDIQKSYTDAEGATQNALMTGADKAITKQYAGTELEDVAVLAKSNIDSSDVSKEMQYTLKMQMASGQIDPMQMLEIFETFGDNKEAMTQVVSIIGKFGGAFANDVMGIAGMFKDKKQAAKFIADIEVKTPKEAKKQLELFQRISQSGTVVEQDVLLNYYNKNPKAAEALQKSLSEIDSLKGKSTIDVVAKTVVLGADEMALLKADQEYFDKLPAEQQKVYLQNMKVMMSMEGDPAMQLAYKNWLGEEGNAGKTFEQYVTAKTQQVTETSTDTTKPPPTPGASSGNKVQSSPLDDIVKKLRDVRKNQIKVTEGWSASSKALNSLFGGKKTLDAFSGIENDLRKIGGSEDLISLIVGMDPKEYEKKKNSLFKFDNKGNIIGLKKDAKNIQEALNSVAMGDFNSKTEAETEVIKDQAVAFAKLSSIGIPVADAYAMVEDAGLAQAIAMEKNSKSVATLAKNYKVLTKAQLEAAAVKGVKTDIDQFKKDRIQENRIRNKYSSTTAFAIGSDENLRALEDAIATKEKEVNDLRSRGKYDAAYDAQQSLNKLTSDFNTRLSQLKSTIGFMQDMFDKGFSNAMEAFDVQETALNIKFKLDTKSQDDVMKKAQEEIALIQYKVDDKEAALKAIEDQEQKINDKYDERIKALDEVEKANAAISNQQRGQLTLAEALTSGDIAAAAKAAQDMRAQQAADAVTKQKDAIEQSREYELMGVTGLDKTDGKLKTRKQLEKEIKNLQDEVFKIEEDRIEPAQEFVRLKQLQLDKDIQNLTVLGKTRDAWESIKNQVDLAMINSKKFIESMQLAIATVPDLKAAYAAETASGNDPIVGAAYDATPTPSATPTASPTPTPSATPTASATPTPSATPKASATPTPTPSVKPSVKPSATPSATPKPTPTPTPTKVPGFVYNPDPNGFKRNVTPTPTPTPKPTTTPKPSFLDADKNGIPDLIQAPPKAVVKPILPPLLPPVAPKKTLVPGTGAYVGSMFIPAQYKSMGGLVQYFAGGGFAKGTDTVPAMLTPGEFVMSKYAVDSYGVDNLKKINNGDATGGAVYNNTYTLTVNAKTDANPNEIAQAVMSTIKQVDDRRIRGIGINGR
jgi:TP901 family phage tail tape measure protein